MHKHVENCHKQILYFSWKKLARLRHMFLNMGGSGKTTLAKELYNKKSSSVQKSSFIIDVRNSASKNELHMKQRQLLKDLGFKFNDQPFDNIEQGKMILSNYWRSLPVFVVLDDVDHKDQLEVLLSGKGSLASGSLIIITTRNREVLNACGISCIYEMKSMNQSHAKQLFCWHAFLQSSPLLGFEALVERFVSVSNGLPLSLKVLGGQLYGCSNKDLWEDLLHKIFRILPNDIINRLKESYDGLDKEEQQMFLDVACFFIGQNKMIAIAVWEGSGWSGQWGWERLVNKCLVEVVGDNEIRMHDHLRDLGREIASTLLPHRLWSPHQLTGINKEEQIRGMELDAATNDVHLFPHSLLNTSIWLCGFTITRSPFPCGLKMFLVGENFGNNLHIAKLSRDLAWLRCSGIAHRNLPSWMPLTNLRVLQLYSCTKIVGLWKDGVEAPVQLRVLIVFGCDKLKRIPKSIGYLKKLKKISLHRGNVKDLPEEFCHLQSLEHVQLLWCERLLSLPSCFGRLTNLQHLDLSHCTQLRMLPDSCKQLMLLQHLNLEWCKQLSLQSDILENMTRLQYLNLNHCYQLDKLPRHITNQASLSELYLWETKLRDLPINIDRLSKLRVMTISPLRGCFQMQSLPDSMGSLTLLEELTLGCLEMQTLPRSFEQLIRLQTLEIGFCPMGELDIGQTFLGSNLKHIELRETRVSKITISDGCCPRLKFLRLRCNGHLREVNTLPTSVEDFYVDDCSELEMLPSFAKLASLKVYRLTGGNKVKRIQGLEECTSLERLQIDGGKCWEVSDIESLEQLQRLKHVQLIAKKRSTLLPCLQMIQKWPEEMIIRTRAIADAGSLLKSSAFPNLSDVQFFAKKKFRQYRAIKYKRFKCSSDGKAMMLCFVIKCVSPTPLKILGGSSYLKGSFRSWKRVNGHGRVFLPRNPDGSLETSGGYMGLDGRFYPELKIAPSGDVKWKNVKWR